MFKYKFFYDFILYFSIFKCPVYRGNFVLKFPFGDRKSVRFKEGPVYNCPVYRGKITKKNTRTNQSLEKCPV